MSDNATTATPEAVAEPPKRVPLLVALGIAVAIIAVAVVIVVLPDLFLGIDTGWMAIMVLTMFLALAMPKGVSWDALKECVGGCAYGMAIGAAFGSLPPLSLALIITGIVLRLRGRLPVLINDYTFCIATVYTISGVSRIGTFWMDILMFLVGVAICAIITKVVTSKGQKA